MATDLLEKTNKTRLAKNHSMLATVKFIFLNWKEHRSDLTAIRLKLVGLRRAVYAQNSTIWSAKSAVFESNKSCSIAVLSRDTLQAKQDQGSP